MFDFQKNSPSPANILLMLIVLHFSSSTLLGPQLGAEDKPSYSWVEHNQGMESWNIASVVIDHQNPSIVYALTTTQGIYKSENSGKTWTQKNAGLPDQPVVFFGQTYGNLLTMDPTNSSIMYTNFNGQVYLTMNGAESWFNRNRGINTCAPHYCVAGVALDPQQPDHIFAAHISSGCRGGIYESLNGGITWSHIAGWGMGSGDLTNDAWTLTIDPTDNKRLYSAPPYLCFLYSTDGGHQWTKSPPAGCKNGSSTVAVHPLHPERILLGHQKGLYLSQDRGLAWTDLTESVPGTVNDIQFSRADPKKAYIASDAGLFSSQDGGLSWIGLDYNETLLIKSIAIHPHYPSTLFFGTYGRGVYKSATGGVSPEPVNEGLPIQRHVQALTIAPHNPHIYDRTIYKGGFYRSSNRGQSWSLMRMHPGVTNTQTILVDNYDSDIVFAGYDKLYRSTNRGSTWTVCFESDTAKKFHDLVMDPQLNPYVDERVSVIYATCADPAELFRSLDGGLTWQKMKKFKYGGKSVRPIVLDPTVCQDPVHQRIIYVGSYAGPLKSVDGGQTWNRIVQGLKNSADVMVEGLALDPTTPRTLYLSTRSNSIFTSTDAGNVWLRALKTPFPTFLGRIIIDFQDPSLLYVFGLNGWVSFFNDFSVIHNMSTHGLHEPHLNFRLTVLQDPLDRTRFLAGDYAQGVVIAHKTETEK